MVSTYHDSILETSAVVDTLNMLDKMKSGHHKCDSLFLCAITLKRMICYELNEIDCRIEVMLYFYAL